MRLGPIAALLLALLAVLSADAQDPLAAARSLLAAWHEDPARLDQARELLDRAAAADPAPETLVELASVWFLVGDFRARTDPARTAAYERGAEVARRAIAANPRGDRAHFMLAINYGRLAEIKGVMRAVTLVGAIREEAATVLRLNPSNVEGLILAGSLAAEMPALLGGDRVKAETLFKRALALDPHRTGGRLELARFYLAGRRWTEAQRELQGVVDEPAPTDLPRWVVAERPRARALLAELYDRGRATGDPRQSP
jgi:tetratricopeptide (TPR) repeat protein